MTLEIKTLDIPGFEKVIHGSDRETNLDAMVAIHSTKRGPALGGCRLVDYASQEAMLQDALTLARTMSYKCALANLKFGGGKCVIQAKQNEKTESLLESMGRFIETFKGQIYTGKDYNISAQDVEVMRRQTSYLVGTQDKSGDPSEMTAVGVYHGIEAALHFISYDTHPTFEDLTFAIRGIGSVGKKIAHKLYKQKATFEGKRKIIVSDIDYSNINSFINSHNHVQLVVPNEQCPNELFYKKFDVLVPCAAGNVINGTTLRALQWNGCKLIAGPENSQLSNEQFSRLLHEQNIIYVPDYVINAGGLINVASDLTGETKEEVKQKVEKLGNTIYELLSESKNKNIPPLAIANKRAEHILNKK